LRICGSGWLVCYSYIGICFAIKADFVCFIVTADSERMPRGKNKKSSKRPVYQVEKTKEINPFELKVNRQKHEVLGRKISKTDKGMPGMSRSKAIKKVCMYMYLSGRGPAYSGPIR